MNLFVFAGKNKTTEPDTLPCDTEAENTDSVVPEQSG